ncbi:MAG: hypothetical protein C0467_14700 [Planctomycetaceae bacterium]|nr:hypothetical protein [Planctomycetaceae bacterium]
MLRKSLLFVALIGLATPAPAVAPSPSPDPKSLIVTETELAKARDLVQKLGSEQYAEREEAELSLANMGRLARVALLDGANNDANAEVRSRCQGLLPKATTLEMKARLEVFLADADGKFEHDLAGWNQFRSIVRKEWTLLGHHIWSDRSLDKEARMVFAELISTPANRHILFAIGGQQSEIGSLAAARRQDLYSQKYPRVVVVGGVGRRPNVQRDPTQADIITLLLAETQAGTSFIPPRSAPISILFQASGFYQAATAGNDRGKVIQSVASAWFDTRHDPLDMYYAMNLASNMGLPDQGSQLAIRLLQSKAAVASYRGMAATTLVRVGNKSHVPLLEKMMTDNTVVFTARKAVAGKPGEVEAHDIQLRDIAVVVSLLISGQKPEDYGFVDQYKGNGSPVTNYNYTRYYVPEGQRDAAMTKWKEWRAKNP